MTRNEAQSSGLKRNFTLLGIWAFSIGTSIGWGSFIVTCNTYLQKSGILGTVFGLLLGMAVISQGEDYEKIDELVGVIAKQNEEALRSGGIVIACGMSKYDGDACVASVFERADQRMYDNKSALKSSAE